LRGSSGNKVGLFFRQWACDSNKNPIVASMKKMPEGATPSLEAIPSWRSGTGAGVRSRSPECGTGKTQKKTPRSVDRPGAAPRLSQVLDQHHQPPPIGVSFREREAPPRIAGRTLCKHHARRQSARAVARMACTARERSEPL
jgi:hypothetical protein